MIDIYIYCYDLLHSTTPSISVYRDKHKHKHKHTSTYAVQKGTWGSGGTLQLPADMQLSGGTAARPKDHVRRKSDWIHTTTPCLSICTPEKEEGKQENGSPLMLVYFSQSGVGLIGNDMADKTVPGLLQGRACKQQTLNPKDFREIYTDSPFRMVPSTRLLCTRISPMIPPGSLSMCKVRKATNSFRGGGILW